MATKQLRFSGQPVVTSSAWTSLPRPLRPPSTRGRNVALDKNGAPTITHDSVTVAKKSSEIRFVYGRPLKKPRPR